MEKFQGEGKPKVFQAEVELFEVFLLSRKRKHGTVIKQATMCFSE